MPPTRRLWPLTRPSTPAALPHRAMMHRMWPDKNNYEWPGKSPDFLAVFYLEKADFRTVCNYFYFPTLYLLACLRAVYLLGYSDIRRVWRCAPAHRLAYAAERAMRVHPWEWADPFGWPNPVSKAQAHAMAPRALVELARLLPRPSTRRLGGPRPMRGVFQMPRGLNARFRERDAAFKERFLSPKTLLKPAIFPGQNSLEIQRFFQAIRNYCCSTTLIGPLSHSCVMEII